MIENICNIFAISSAVLGIILAFVGFFKSKGKGKLKKFVELAKIVKKIPNYIIEAENIVGPGNGATKLALVMNKLQIDCLANNVDYDEQALEYEVEKILETPQKKEELTVENKEN